MSYDDAFRFEPPKHGLISGESVIWQKYPGISFPTIFCGSCSPLLAVIPGLFIFFYFGEMIGFAFLFLLLIAFVLSLRRFIIERRTMYYITSERVIYAVGGQIVQAILLDHFEGHQKEDYLEISETARENGSPIYRVTIKDPKAPLTIRLNNVRDDIAETFEKLGERVLCRSCNHSNIAIRRICKNCGVSL